MPPKRRKSKPKAKVKAKRKKCKVVVLDTGNNDSSEDVTSCSSLIGSAVDSDNMSGFEDHSVSEISSGSGWRSYDDRKLDINTSTITALRNVGISQVIAQKIVKYRKKQKCFVHMNELMRIRGINPELFSLITKLVAVKTNPMEISSILNGRRNSSRLLKPSLKRSRKSIPGPFSETNSSTSKEELTDTSVQEKPSNRICKYSHSANNFKNRFMDRLPRGSASLSSVVSVSPKAHPRSEAYRDRDMGRSRQRVGGLDRDEHRQHHTPNTSTKYMRYEHTIPRSKARSLSPCYRRPESSPLARQRFGVKPHTVTTSLSRSATGEQATTERSNQPEMLTDSNEVIMCNIL